MINIIGFVYKYLIKPLLFTQDAEEVHHNAIALGKSFSNNPFIKKILKLVFYKNQPQIQVEICNLTFRSPIGLAAGFDYEGELGGVLPYIGFGFESAGTVTYNSYEGNAKPRLGRLPKSRSLLVNKGFKSSGVANMVNNLKFVKGFPLGLSIGATNSEDTSTPDAQIKDIINSFKYVKAHPVYKKLSYLELNISCPNVRGSGTLANEYNLEEVLKQIRELKINKPLFVKFPIEIEDIYAKKLVRIMIEYNVDVVIIGNLAKDRSNELIDKEELAKVGKGNFSGKPTWDKSNRLISEIYKEFGHKIKIIGVGGVFNATDAYEKIVRGASLVQLITGMIYEGPQLIAQINKGLVQHLSNDGFTHISQAVGSKTSGLE